MMNKKSTKKALLMSVLSLLLCFSMLIGTTFAWFTDEVTSGVNQIVAGNLDVELIHTNGSVTDASVKDATNLFVDQDGNAILWEPGVVAYETLTVKNVGTLALKYNLAVTFGNENYLDGHGLSEVLKIGVIDGTVAAGATREEVTAQVSQWQNLMDFCLMGALEAKTNSDPVTIVIYWKPNSNEIDNLFNVNNGQEVSDLAETGKNELHIDLGIKLVATQQTSEDDSFDDQYDAEAALPTYAVGSATVVENPPVAGYEIDIIDENTGYKIGSAVVPAAALAEDTTEIEVQIIETDLNGNITVADDEIATTYSVIVTGLREGNTDPVKITLNIGTARKDVKVYHYEELMTSVSYSPFDPYVIFSATDFSPFTVVYDDELLILEGSTARPEDMVKAEVTDADEHEGVTLAWGRYGAWSPSDPTQTLESAYVFTAPHTAETVDAYAYKDWYCDYFVSIDRELEIGQIFLGGNYGSFGWVGFENPVEIEANQEIPLLMSVAGAWTYEAIATNVGTFTCGVAQAKGHEGELDGATFTVKLRLINPANENEYYDVNVVEYTFGKTVTDATQLKDALANGENVTLSNDITLTDESLAVTGEAVINLNGHTLSGTSNSSTTSCLIKVSSGAELTLTGNGLVTFEAANPDVDWNPEGFPTYANNTIRCEGKLVIDGVTIKNTTNPGGASYAIDCYPGADLVVNSGVIDGCGKLAIRMFCNSNTVPTNVTINGGTITGKRAVWIQLPSTNIANERLANLTITGGELICTNTEVDVCVYSYSYGDSFAKTNITITGGEFTGDVCFGGGNAKTTKENVTITGGTFSGYLGRYLDNDGWEDIAKP